MARRSIPPADERILVAEIGRAHGLRGEVRIEIHSDVEDRFEPGNTLYLVPGSTSTDAQSGAATPNPESKDSEVKEAEGRPRRRREVRQRRPRIEVVRVTSFRPARGGGLIAFEGFEGRDRAEVLRGYRLEVDRSQVPEAPEGHYYFFDLMGCECQDRQVGPLGKVDDVIEDGGGVLLSVRRGSRTLLVPFVDAFLDTVDIEGKTITFDLPEGLIEACVSES